MCGIIAYSGHRPAVPVIMEGLRRLEYRGYDSSGLAFIQHGAITCIRAEGKLQALDYKLSIDHDHLLASCAIGHTRWATHGVPVERNAHPHTSSDGRFALVHNGIIENYHELKKELSAKGHTFCSDTDSEVLANLIAEERKSAPDNLHAFTAALRRAQGAYAIVLTCLDEPDVLYGARHSAPLILGVGTGENFLGSDVTAFLVYTKKVVFLDEGEIARITPNTHEIYRLADLSLLSKPVQEIDWDIQAAQKEGYKHFMLKEIFEQPKVLQSCLACRVETSENSIILPEMEYLPLPERLRIVACGTSYNAGLWAAPLIEQWAGIPASVEIASEFRYRNPILVPGELVLLISQSGETADTLASLKIARANSCNVLSICNVNGSSLARESDVVLYTQAGPEISVASTKALCSQMAVLMVLAMYWGEQKRLLPPEKMKNLIAKLLALPETLAACLPGMAQEAEAFAQMAASFNNLFFLGRGQNYALAMEGALKFKELSYVHAEAYAAGEMKHGPIAMIDKNFLTVALAPRDEHFAKISSNIEEIIARSGPVLLLSHAGTEGCNSKADKCWTIPPSEAPFSSFFLLPMLQLLAYEAATYMGKDVDQPRNLAKSVTVE